MSLLSLHKSPTPTCIHGTRRGKKNGLNKSSLGMCLCDQQPHDKIEIFLITKMQKQPLM